MLLTESKSGRRVQETDGYNCSISKQTFFMSQEELNGFMRGLDLPKKTWKTSLSAVLLFNENEQATGP